MSSLKFSFGCSTGRISLKNAAQAQGSDNESKISANARGWCSLRCLLLYKQGIIIPITACLAGQEIWQCSSCCHDQYSLHQHLLRQHRLLLHLLRLLHHHQNNNYHQYCSNYYYNYSCYNNYHNKTAAAAATMTTTAITTSTTRLAFFNFQKNAQIYINLENQHLFPDVPLSFHKQH